MKLMITFTKIYDYVSTAIDSAVAGFGSGLVTFVAAPLALAATIYFLLLGIAILRGAVQSPIRELVYQAGKVGFVLAAASSIGYSTFVINIVTKLPDEIIAAGSGQKIENTGTIFDNYVSDTNKVLTPVVAANDSVQSQTEGITDFSLVMEKAYSNLTMLIAMVILFIFACASAAVGFCIVIFAKLSLSICVALAPLALACLLFDSSRWLFDGWLHQTANYILLFVIMSIMTKFITGLEAKVMTDIVGIIGEGKDFIVIEEGKIVINALGIGFAICSCIIIYIVGTMFFFQSPSIAAGIAGGAASGGHGFLQSGMNMAAGKLLSRKGGGGNSGDGGGGGGGGGGGKVKRGK